MRRTALVALATILAGLAVAPAPAANEAVGPVRLGIPRGLFRDVPPTIIQTAATPFKEMFKRQTGVTGDIVLAEDCEVIAEKMKSRELHFGVFHGFEYAWVKDRYPEIQPLVVTVPYGRTVQACLVVNADTKAAQPADLKDACVTVPYGTKAHCVLFLDRLREGLPAKCCVPERNLDQSSEDILDSVALGKCPAALVDGAFLTSYEKNKPGASARLKVLCRSEPFPAGVIVYRKGLVDDTLVAKVRNGLVKAHENAQSRGFMMLWNLKGFEDIPADYDADLKRILKVYPPPAK